MTTGLFSTEDRQKHALFSQPIWSLPDGLLVKSQMASELYGYTSIAERNDFTLAVIKNQVQHQTALSLGVPTDRILVFDTYEAAAMAVRNGSVSAYASVEHAHKGYLQQNHGLNLNIVSVPAAEKKPADGCFAFAKADLKLQSAVNEVLFKFIRTPDHIELLNRFGM